MRQNYYDFYFKFDEAHCIRRLAYGRDELGSIPAIVQRTFLLSNAFILAR